MKELNIYYQGVHAYYPYWMTLITTAFLLYVASPFIANYYPSYGDDITLLVDGSVFDLRQWFYHGYSNWLISSEQYQDYFYTYSRPFTNFITFILLSVFGDFDHFLLLNYLFISVCVLLSLLIIRDATDIVNPLVYAVIPIVLVLCPLVYADFYLNYAYFQVVMYLAAILAMILALIKQKIVLAAGIMFIAILLKDNSFLLPTCVSIVILLSPVENARKKAFWVFVGGCTLYTLIHLNLVNDIVEGGGDASSVLGVFAIFDIFKVPANNTEIGQFQYVLTAIFSLPALSGITLQEHVLNSSFEEMVLVSIFNLIILFSAYSGFRSWKSNDRAFNVVLIFWLLVWIQYLLFHGTPRWGVDCFALSIIVCAGVLTREDSRIGKMAFIILCLWFILPGTKTIETFNQAKKPYLDKYLAKENTKTLVGFLAQRPEGETIYLLNSPYGIEDRYLELFSRTKARIVTLTHFEKGVPSTSYDSNQDVYIKGNEIRVQSYGFKPNVILKGLDHVDFDKDSIEEVDFLFISFKEGLPGSFIYFNPSTKSPEFWDVSDSKVTRTFLGRIGIDEGDGRVVVSMPVECESIEDIQIHDKKSMQKLSKESISNFLTNNVDECVLSGRMNIDSFGRHMHIEVYGDDDELLYRTSFLRHLEAN